MRSSIQSLSLCLSVCLSLCMCLLGGVAHAGVTPIDEVFAPDAKNYSSDHYGKVAVVAWVSEISAPLTDKPAEAEAYKAQNREELAKYISEAAENGAEFVVTPEFGVVGYPDIPELPSEDDNFQNPEQIAPYAEALPGKSTKFFGALAKRLNIYIQFGMAENDNGHFHNTAIVMGPTGDVVASYRKIHLYEGETKFLEPGDQPVMFDSPFGKIGMLICSDVYSPHPMQAYKDNHVDVLSLSTSWAQFNSGWSAFTQGAVQTDAYLMAANQTYFPDSGVINPDGSAQSHIRQSTGVAYGYLPRAPIRHK